MTYQFTDNNNEVTVQTKWNTLYQYRRQDGDLYRIKSAVALVRYRLYQRAVRNLSRPMRQLITRS
jgi:hypothetical protein